MITIIREDEINIYFKCSCGYEGSVPRGCDIICQCDIDNEIRWNELVADQQASLNNI